MGILRIKAPVAILLQHKTRWRWSQEPEISLIAILLVGGAELSMEGRRADPGGELGPKGGDRIMIELTDQRCFQGRFRGDAVGRIGIEAEQDALVCFNQAIDHGAEGQIGRAHPGRQKEALGCSRHGTGVVGLAGAAAKGIADAERLEQRAGAAEAKQETLLTLLAHTGAIQVDRNRGCGSRLRDIQAGNEDVLATIGGSTLQIAIGKTGNDQAVAANGCHRPADIITGCAQ